MASAVRPLGSLSMARGCARIDAGPDTAKIGSADRVQVHYARLLAVIGARKTFPHGLGQKRHRRMEGLLAQSGPYASGASPLTAPPSPTDCYPPPASFTLAT